MSRITTNLLEAISYLRNGDIVAIPTETVYGLAANAENDNAIRKVFEIKQRPFNHPLILHVPHNSDLTRWVFFIPHYAYLLMHNFWPGPLTLVMKTYPKQNHLITGGQDTIAVRCPNHPVAQTLLNELKFPLVAPSANPFGKISPTTAKHVQDSFEKESVLILDGGRCTIGIESTIIDATHPETYKILRQGMITEEDIEKVLPNLSCSSKSGIRVPGQLANHYQPEKPLFYFSDLEDIKTLSSSITKKLYVIAFTPANAPLADYFFQLPQSPNDAAYELYYQLRQADQSEANIIAIQLPPDEEKWQAIKERIHKAGSSLKNSEVQW